MKQHGTLSYVSPYSTPLRLSPAYLLTPPVTSHRDKRDLQSSVTKSRSSDGVLKDINNINLAASPYQPSVKSMSRASTTVRVSNKTPAPASLKSVVSTKTATRNTMTVETDEALDFIEEAYGNEIKKILTIKEAFERHEKIEKLRALHYVKLSDKDKEIEEKLSRYKHRVIMLKQLTAKCYSYAMKAGERAKENIIIDIKAGELITKQQQLDMVAIMVDKDSFTWGEAKIIAKKPYSTPLIMDRTIFRKKRHGLWTTAAAAFKSEVETLYYLTNKTKYERCNPTLSLRTIYSHKRSRQQSNRTSCTVPVTSKNASKASKAQHKRFTDLQKKLAGTIPFLNADFHSSRMVSDCPVLLQAHRKNNRSFLSSNANATCTGLNKMYSTIM